jgi:hypothetical protein
MLPPELFNFTAEKPGLTLDLAASPEENDSFVARGMDHGLVMATTPARDAFRAANRAAKLGALKHRHQTSSPVRNSARGSLNL